MKEAHTSVCLRIQHLRFAETRSVLTDRFPSPEVTKLRTKVDAVAVVPASPSDLGTYSRVGCRV